MSIARLLAMIHIAETEITSTFDKDFRPQLYGHIQCSGVVSNLDGLGENWFDTDKMNSQIYADICFSDNFSMYSEIEELKKKYVGKLHVSKEKGKLVCRLTVDMSLSAYNIVHGMRGRDVQLETVNGPFKHDTQTNGCSALVESIRLRSC